MNLYEIHFTKISKKKINNMNEILQIFKLL